MFRRSGRGRVPGLRGDQNILGGALQRLGAPSTPIRQGGEIREDIRMTTSTPQMTGQLTSKAAWRALQDHSLKIKDMHLRKLFEDDPRRGERMTAQAIGIYFDYSKHRITDGTLKLLFQLAKESGLQGRIDAMFR